MSPEADVVFTGGDMAWNLDRVHDSDQNVTEKKSPGGSLYYCAMGAVAALQEIPDVFVGVSGAIGTDFSLDTLMQLGIDVEGIHIDPSLPTAQFILDQYPDNTRTFHAERGAAESVNTSIWPSRYTDTSFIHLATGLPNNHLTWLEFFEGKVHGTISADTFEQFVRDFPDETKAVLEPVDLIFINQEECDMLGGLSIFPASTPLIVKDGPRGATYIHQEYHVTVPAPTVDVVDTTGAGDVLAGAFLALRAADVPIDESLMAAVTLASASVTTFGVDHLIHE